MIKIVLLIIFALLSYSPKSDAACTYQSMTQDFCANEGEAYNEAWTLLAYLRSNGFGACNVVNTGKVEDTVYGHFHIETTNCYTSIRTSWPKAQTCSAQPPITGTGDYNAGDHGDIRCYQGCQQVVNETTSSFSLENNGATCDTRNNWGAAHCPANYVWNSTFAICSPLPPDADGDGVPDTEDEWPTDPTRTKDTDNDGVADEFDALPNDPGETTDTDNDGVGDNGDFSPDNPDNGQDSGTGNESDNTSSGGGDCETTPISEGDAITAQIAYQSWKGRCAAEALLEKVDQMTATVTGDVTNCQAAYQCTGNSLECAKVDLARQEVCGANSVTVTLPGDSNANGIPDALEGVEADLSAAPTGAEALESPQAAIDRGEAAFDSIDTSGFLGSGSCPGLPPIHVMGQTFDMSTQVCDQASVFAALLRMFAMFAATVIIVRGVTN